MTATGTVTWIDGERVLGFGHPLFGLGAIDIPMTGATVQTLLPSLMRSSRVATPTAEIGALRQDRASGVFGLLDARPRMIPVRLQISDALRGDQVYSFDIADDPLLSPLLLYVSLGGILTSRERPAGSATIRLREGSVIKMADGEDVELDNVYAGPRAFEYGTGIAAYVLYLLMNNTWSQPQIAGVNLILEYDELPRTATIRSVAFDRYRVRAGENDCFEVSVDKRSEHLHGPLAWTLGDRTPVVLEHSNRLSVARAHPAREQVGRKPHVESTEYIPSGEEWKNSGIRQRSSERGCRLNKSWILTERGPTEQGDNGTRTEHLTNGSEFALALGDLAKDF